MEVVFKTNYAFVGLLYLSGSNNGSNFLELCCEFTIICGGTSSSEDQVELLSLLRIISSFSALYSSAASVNLKFKLLSNPQPHNGQPQIHRKIHLTIFLKYSCGQKGLDTP